VKNALKTVQKLIKNAAENYANKSVENGASKPVKRAAKNAASKDFN